MIAVLVDHIGEPVFGLQLVFFATQSATTPGNLLPDENAQTVAQAEDYRRLLVVAQSDEVDTHLLHHQHLLTDLGCVHRGSYSCMVFVPVGTPK